MTQSYDVAAIGNAIVDVISPSSDAFLSANGLDKGAMMLIDEARGVELYAKMAAGVEASGGSAGNTIAGIANFGGKAAYIGKVAKDQLGEVFTHDMRSQGAWFDVAPLVGGPATARCLINVTDDGQRTMCTYLGASVALTAADIPDEIIKAAKVTYLEGYLFDPPEARKAFVKAAGLARTAGGLISLTLSDSFVVDRHRDDLMAFIESDVDILFANESEITALFQTSSFDEAAKAIAPKVRIAAITRSEKGSVVVAGGEYVTAFAEPVEKVVDTTGAGDQYAAGFLFGYTRGKPMAACATLGSIAAAEVISHYGPRPLVSLKELAAAKGL